MRFLPWAKRKTEPQELRTSALSWFGRTQAGVTVTASNVLKLSAVWACVRVISETIATLPWRAHRRTADDQRELIRGPLTTLINTRASPEMSAVQWRETMLAWALTWGNGYSEIERDVVGRPLALWPLAPDCTWPERVDGELVYKTRVGGKINTLPARDVFHLRGLGYDGLVGYSVIAMAAQSVGLGLAAEQFGAAFYGNGATLNGILKHPENPSDDAMEKLRQWWKEMFSGPANAFKVPVLREGMEYQSIGVPAKDAQFLETRKFQVNEICRWFRVQPHLVQDLDRSTNNNIEHQGIEFVQYTLRPWVVRLEQEANYKLTLRPDVFTRVNMDAIARGDLKSRTEHYDKMLQRGVYSVNDVLRLEDQNGIGADGDKRLVQLNQTTLERIGEDAPEPVEPTDDSGATPAPAGLLVGPMRDAMARIGKREANAYESHKGKDADAFATAWRRFTDKHEAYIVDALSAISASYGQSIDVTGDAVAIALNDYASIRSEIVFIRGTEASGGAFTPLDAETQASTLRKSLRYI